MTEPECQHPDWTTTCDHCGETLYRNGESTLTGSDGYDNHLPRDWRNNPVNTPLVDDLANVLASTCVGWTDVIGHDLAEAPEVKRVMARYKTERLHR